MISKRLESLTKRNSAIRAMFEEGNRLAEKYGRENVYDFSLGNPCVESPEKVKKSIIDILSTEKPLDIHGYMPNSGYVFVRKTIAEFLNKNSKAHYGPNHIIMVVGAAGGLNCILQTLLNPGDEVIVVAPFFVEYTNYIENWGGNTIIAQSDEKTFMLSVENIREKISSNTKAIILNNPNNPTGVVYSEDNIRELSQALLEKEKEYGHPIYIVSDEPYRELVYDGKSVPFIPNFYSNTMIVYSWSKSLSLPGERIGYLAISPTANDTELIFNAASISNRIIGFVNAPSLMQRVVESCIDCQPRLEEYDENRKLLYDELTKIGYECTYPQGAFYLWMKTPCDEGTFVDKAKEYNLLLVKGSAFYRAGYVRIAYCVSKETVINSISAFKKLWEAVN